MKLKLEIRDKITILSVTEGINAQDLQVLNAGINKLVQSGKKLLLLDLSPLNHDDFQPASILEELVTMQAMVQMAAAQLLIVSKIGDIGEVPTREKGLELLNSSMGKLIALESKLKQQVKAMAREKADLERQLKVLQARTGSADLLLLRRENGELKALITRLETQIKRRLTYRSEPFETTSMVVKKDNLTRVMVSILEQVGALPVT